MDNITIAWFYEIKSEPNQYLFDLEDLGIENDFKYFFCYCGNIKKVNSSLTNNYKCNWCGNKRFINIEKIIHLDKSITDKKEFKEKIKKFNLNYKMGILNNKIQAICYINFPVAFKYNKFQYQELPICSMDINKYFSALLIKQKYKKYIKEKLLEMVYDKEEFVKYLNLDFKLSRKGTQIREKQIIFYSLNYNLKSKEFMNWNYTNLLRNANNLDINKALLVIGNYTKFKSVKKAIYKNYLFQKHSFTEFNPLFIYAITKKIKDPNFMVRLINMYLINSELFLKDIKLNVFLDFLDFLLKHYTVKQVVIFFSHFETYLKMDFDYIYNANRHFLDILRQFRFANSTIKNNFTKVRCTPRRIHDEFVRIINFQKNKHLVQKKFEYSEVILNTEMKIKDYKVKLPKNGAELYLWADILRNCMASFINQVAKQKTLIYGFFLDGVLMFGVEVTYLGEIAQAYGKYNRELTAKEQDVLYLWFEKIKGCFGV